MADKPKTYPQQIQDLKTQLAASQELVIELQKQQTDTIPQLQAENQKLKDTVAELSKEDRSSSLSDRTRANDLQQRAESAEQRLKAAQQANAVLQADLEKILAGVDHSVELQRALASKEQTIEDLRAQVQLSNNRVLQIQREAGDRVSEAQREVESMSAELKQLRLTSKHYANTLAELQETASLTITKLTTNLDAAQERITALTQMNTEYYQTIRRFQEILEEVPDTKAQLAALLDRVQIAESTV